MISSKNLISRIKLKSSDSELTEINEKNYIKSISKNLKQILTSVNVENDSAINNKISDIKNDLIVNSNAFNTENNLIMNNKTSEIKNNSISNDTSDINFNADDIINNFKMNNSAVNQFIENNTVVFNF